MAIQHAHTMPHMGPMPSTRAHAAYDVHGLWLTVGRALFGGFFLYSGIHHFTDLAMMAPYTAMKGVPAPEFAVMASGASIILGGLSLLLGLWPRLGAAMILVFLAGVTPIMHNFWAESGQARLQEMGNFMKNVALMGGACLAAAVPTPWPGSLHLGRPHETDAHLYQGARL